MAGIATGLGAVDSEYAAVVACDMPFVDPAFLDYLFERAASHEAAVPRPDEWFQTTQAVYHAEAMQAPASERWNAASTKSSNRCSTLSTLSLSAKTYSHTPHWIRSRTQHP